VNAASTVFFHEYAEKYFTDLCESQASWKSFGLVIAGDAAVVEQFVNLCLMRIGSIFESQELLAGSKAVSVDKREVIDRTLKSWTTETVEAVVASILKQVAVTRGLRVATYEELLAQEAVAMQQNLSTGLELKALTDSSLPLVDIFKGYCRNFTKINGNAKGEVSAANCANGFIGNFPQSVQSAIARKDLERTDSIATMLQNANTEELACSILLALIKDIVIQQDADRKLQQQLAALKAPTVRPPTVAGVPGVQHQQRQQQQRQAFSTEPFCPICKGPHWKKNCQQKICRGCGVAAPGHTYFNCSTNGRWNNNGNTNNQQNTNNIQNGSNSNSSSSGVVYQ